MSLHTLTQNNDQLTKHQVEEAFDGNLCRCTGYRPILDAAKKFTEISNVGKTEFPQVLKRSPQPLQVDTGSVKWFAPLSFQELLELKFKYPTAKLVCGASEIGVETKYNYFGKQSKYDTYIYPQNIKELSEIKEDSKSITIGASVTLSTLYDHSRKATSNPLFESISDQLRWFSGTQIRNVATIGGNIITASPISDLNPIWLAMGATLQLVSTTGRRTVNIRDFYKGYRQVDIKGDEVLESITIPKATPEEHVFAFKQARRREDDIAIVNAGLRFKLKSDVFESVGMSFGGMGVTSKIAHATEKLLIGKKMNDVTLHEALECLRKEFKLEKTVPGGMPDFRQVLVLSFFEKAWLTMKGKKDLTIHRGISQSEQVFTPVLTGTSVGQSVTHLAAKLQVSGEAQYTDDIPSYKNELYAAAVYTTIPKGTLKKVDATKVLEMPGVKAFYSAKDVHHNMWGPIVVDEEIFVSKDVLTVGQMIGCVVADSAKLAKEAAKLVLVEYEESKPILSMAEAIEAKSYLGEHVVQNGDITTGLKNSDIIIEGDIKIGGQEHFYFEPLTTISVPLDNSELLIYASTQNLNEVQHHVGHALGIPSHKITAKAKRIGGGFGGKETRTVPLAVMTSLAASKLQVPVRAVLDRDTDMVISGQRHPFYAKYKLGISKEGKIQAFDVNLYSNGGYSLDLSMPILDRALLHMDNCYNIPNIRFDGKACRTNLPSNTAFRGFGGPQGMLVIEDAIDRAAAQLGMDKNKLRQMNFYKEGDVTPFGQKLDGWNVPSSWDQMLKNSDYENRVIEIAKFNKNTKHLKRGISMIPTKFGIAFTFTTLNQGGCLVNIYTDGSVLISHGGVEMGQGLNAKVAQVAATVLGVPLKTIHISETSTDKVPNSSATAASMGSDLYGEACKNACDQLVERLAPIKKKLGGNPTLKEIAVQAWMDRVNLSAQGYFAPKNIGYTFAPDGRGKGSPFRYFTQGVAVSEVVVDTLTGDFTTLRSDILMDVGDSINPAIDIGQIEGAFMQGVGLFTMEELVMGDHDHPWVKKGLLHTRGPGNYKIPSSNDIPVDMRVHLVKNVPNDIAIMRSKAIGEPPLFLGSTVFFAIKDALASARKDNGVTGSLILDSPATCERIRMSTSDKLSKIVTGHDNKHYRAFSSN
jgi:xanthine dehydrogenase/oxidase